MSNLLQQGFVRALVLVLAAILLPGSGCETVEGPEFCLVTTAMATHQKELGAVTCDLAAEAHSTHPVVLATGEVYVLRHELPAGIEPPGKLHLEIGMPCGASEQLDVDYGLVGDRRVALVSRVAPQGAECGLVATATIANSSITRTSASDVWQCEPNSCQQPADAGL